MEYSINELSKIAKISTRTLRYYHEINLLEPKRINSSGYRIYGEYEKFIYSIIEQPLEDAIRYNRHFWGEIYHKRLRMYKKGYDTNLIMCTKEFLTKIYNKFYYHFRKLKHLDRPTTVFHKWNQRWRKWTVQ